MAHHSVVPEPDEILPIGAPDRSVVPEPDEILPIGAPDRSVVPEPEPDEIQRMGAPAVPAVPPELIGVDHAKSRNRISGWSENHVHHEAEAYSTLTLAHSTYDNAFVLGVLHPSFLPRASLLLGLTLFMQWAVLYLLSWQIERNETSQFLKVFAPGQGSVCHQDDGFYGKWTCSPSEARSAFNFNGLDLNEDGLWTHAEAVTFSGRYEMTTKRSSNMGQFYKNFFKIALRYAPPQAPVQCVLGDTVQFYSQSRRQWVNAELLKISGFSQSVRVNLLETGATNSTWLEVNEVMLSKNITERLRCEVAKCRDLDLGLFDAHGLQCMDHITLDTDTCGGSQDDADFSAAELCCHCGGGANALELQQRPLNFSMDEMVSAPFWKCFNKAVGEQQQDECIIQFSRIPRIIFEEEIATLAPFCLIPERELCENLAERNMLPQLNFENSSTVPLLLKMMEVSSQEFLMNKRATCKQVVDTYCRELHAVESPWLVRRKEVCGLRTTEIRGGLQIVQYSESLVHNSEIFGRNTFIYKAFLFMILFLWSLASVSEFRDLVRWLIVLTYLPSHDSETKGYSYVDSSAQEGEFRIIAVAPVIRIITLALNLAPRAILECFTVWVGFRYLLSVNSIPDLILNSLALTFLQQLDEMMFAAFGGQQSATLIENCKPLVGRSLKCVDFVVHKLHVPIGLLICVPVIGLEIGFFVYDNERIERLATAMACLCDMEGSTCYAQQMLKA